MAIRSMWWENVSTHRYDSDVFEGLERVHVQPAAKRVRHPEK